MRLAIATLVSCLLASSFASAAPSLVPPFVLVNANTGTQVPFIDGVNIDPSQGILWFVIAKANTSTGSAQFRLDADLATLDNNRPFTSQPGLPARGSHALAITPYQHKNAGGAAGSSVTINFTVADIQPTPTPSPTPTPTPSPTPTPTPTPLPTPTPTPTPSPTPTATPTPSPSPSPTVSPSATPSPSASPARTISTDGSLANVRSAITAAADGDIITLPAGNFNWASQLVVTKYVTLQGLTTITGAGTRAPSADDQTNIVKDFAGALITTAGLSPTGGGANICRITGLTITEGANGTESNVQGTIHLTGASFAAPITRLRVDNCHLTGFKGGGIAIAGWTYGLADHNWLEPGAGAADNVYFSEANYGGGIVGNGAWADYPFYGTSKFFFVEDSTFIGAGKNPTNGAMDAETGGRFVVRHNYFKNCRPGWHGTEGNRGMRANEIYNNTFEWSIQPSSLNRSGTTLYHDNNWLGVKPTAHSAIQIYRVFGGVGYNDPYGDADGANVLDMNDTEGDGTFVEGHAPHLYESGSADGGSTSTVTDNAKTWTTNQWAGFSVTQANTAAASYPRCGYITGNTAHSITFVSYGTTDRGPLLTFAAGDAYTIHKLLRAMDQGGAGKTDLLKGGGTGNNTPVINTTTNSKSYAHAALEPMMSWNNVFSDGTALGFGTNQPTEQQGRDYYNLGKGLTTNGAPSQVTSIYTAAVNGVAYTAPFTYPHPFTAR